MSLRSLFCLVLSGHSKRPKIGFQDQLSLNADQKCCRMLQGEHSAMLQGEHSAILLTFLKLPFVIKIFVLSIFEWPFYTVFTVNKKIINHATICRIGTPRKMM